MNQKIVMVTEPELVSLITEAVARAFKGMQLPQPTDQTHWLSFDEAWKYLGISKPTLRKLTIQGKFTAYPVGRQIRYNKQELDQSIKNNPLKRK
ncbi:MAG: helix-turn-helix domain-containing protein [Pedobacter sp.]|nr:MAG: helix-turn-helix domain-containing protein [Pedobacter sp.]